MKRTESPRRSGNSVGIYAVFAVILPVLLGLGLIHLAVMGSIEPLWALVTAAGIASMVDPRDDGLLRRPTIDPLLRNDGALRGAGVYPSRPARAPRSLTPPSLKNVGL